MDRRPGGSDLADPVAAIAIETGLQNSTIALGVAISLLGNSQLAVIPGLYGVWMLINGFGLALWAGRRLTPQPDGTVTTGPDVGADTATQGPPSVPSTTPRPQRTP